MDKFMYQGLREREDRVFTPQNYPNSDLFLTIDLPIESKNNHKNQINGAFSRRAKASHMPGTP